jgi:hypothetical protein
MIERPFFPSMLRSIDFCFSLGARSIRRTSIRRNQLVAPSIRHIFIHRNQFVAPSIRHIFIHRNQFVTYLFIAINSSHHQFVAYLFIAINSSQCICRNQFVAMNDLYLFRLMRREYIRIQLFQEMIYLCKQRKIRGNSC